MAEIITTNGYVVLVDDADYPELSKRKWTAIKKGNMRYARNRVYSVKDGKHVCTETLMHRHLVDDGSRQIDHLNGNGLDNRRSNLRGVSHSENQRNRCGPQRNSTSGVRGVHWDKSNGRWIAAIVVFRKCVHLGCFDTLEEAAAARLRGEQKYWTKQDRARALMRASGEKL